MAALRHRRRTGEGQLIDMAQLESSVAALSAPIFAHDNGAPPHERLGNRVSYAAPHGAYRVIDGDAARDDRWIALACLTEEHWQAAAEAMGHAEWASDERFASLDARKANEDALDELISGWTTTQSGEEALSTLQAAGVPAGIVLRASEVLADEHVNERGYYVYPDHVEAGARAYDGAGFLLSESPNAVRGPAPLLGEHTFEVATEVLGIDPDEVAQLIADEVLF